MIHLVFCYPIYLEIIKATIYSRPVVSKFLGNSFKMKIQILLSEIQISWYNGFGGQDGGRVGGRQLSIFSDYSISCFLWGILPLLWGFLDGSVGKESICNAGDMSLIPGSGRPPRGGNGHPLQYSCLENPMDRGAWRAIFHGVTVRYNLATKHSFSCISVM